jgi:hypothetical protein
MGALFTKPIHVHRRKIKKSASIAISIFFHYHKHAIGKGNFFNSGLDWVVPLASSRFDIIVRRVETFAKRVAALLS